VTHVITSLGRGGAETMLLKLLRATDSARFRSSVISLSGDGPLADKIRQTGARVQTLSLRGPRALAAPWKLVRSLRRERPDVVQTWMYHADFCGGLATVGLPGTPLVWNIRCGRLERTVDKRTTIWISRLCATLSHRLPTRILCCSEASLRAHSSTGYDRSRMQVIPNGFDLDEFRPDPLARRAVREDLGLDRETLLVGIAARFDGAKDYRSFCEAAGRIRREHPRAHFLLCGDGVTACNPALRTWITAAGIATQCHLLGPREDMPRILASLDIAVSSSRVEGFPNVLGEAMSCGVPCVATDAGDSRSIVGDTGYIARAGAAVSLAAGISTLIEIGAERRAALGELARRRVQERFAIAATARQYERVYEELATLCAA
jgi:glycosyltransferase involved in cell wall biosynthesis